MFPHLQDRWLCGQRLNILVSCNKCVIDNIEPLPDLFGLSRLSIFIGLFWINSNSLLWIWQRDISVRAWEGCRLTGGCRNGFVITQMWLFIWLQGIFDRSLWCFLNVCSCCWGKGLCNQSCSCFSVFVWHLPDVIFGLSVCGYAVF